MIGGFIMKSLNLKTLAYTAGVLFLAGAVCWFWFAGVRSAERHAEAEARAVAAGHALSLEKIGRKLIAKDLQIRGLKEQLAQAERAAVAEVKFITKIQKVEVIRDQIIDQVRAEEGLNRPVDPAAKRLLIDLYDRLCAEAEAGACAGDDTGAGDSSAGRAPGHETAVPDIKPAPDRNGG